MTTAGAATSAPPTSCTRGQWVAFCMRDMHNAVMPSSVTIRNVPDNAHAELAARAARAGQSLQEYLRSQLMEIARRPDVNAVMERVRQRKRDTGTGLSADQILRYRDQDRR